ncbi:MAG: hypothetical protein ROW52_08295, partial [Anaerolineaceae bacterium]
ARIEKLRLCPKVVVFPHASHFAIVENSFQKQDLKIRRNPSSDAASDNSTTTSNEIQESMLIINKGAQQYE